MPSTLYAKIEETIATEIAQGEYRPGDQLPTEDELLQRFQVSRITVRRAIQNLVSRGLLEIRRGLGTFVLSPRIGAELTKLTGFVEDMKSVGRRASARVVSQDVIAASARVAERLQLDWATRRAHETRPKPDCLALLSTEERCCEEGGKFTRFQMQNKNFIVDIMDART